MVVMMTMMTMAENMAESTNPLAPEGKPKPDIRENEAYLAPGDHADSDGEAVHALAQHAQGACLLADDGDDGQCCGQAQDAGLKERAEVGPHAHRDEEHGDQEARNGLDELLEGMLAAAGKVPIVDVLEDQARRKGAHNRRQADCVREPRQNEAERQPHREQHASSAEPGGRREQPRRQRDAQQQGANEEHRGLDKRQPDIRVGERLSPVCCGDESRHDGEDDGSSTSSITAEPRMIRASRL